VDRRQVLAYRVSAHGLHRDTAAVEQLEVLDLGVQETNVGSARLALAARLPAGSSDALTDPALTLLWSFRGAPHLHRTADLPRLAVALWPLGDADARARLAAERKPLKEAGIGALEAFSAAAEALREVVDGPTPKGEASAGVTARLPSAYSYACRSCAATHVYGGLFQLAGLPAGVRLLPDRAATTLAPLLRRPAVPDAAAGTDAVVRDYLRLHGPATLDDAARYLGTTRTQLRPAWPDDLAEAQVDGRSAWLPQERVGALRDAPTTRGLVRLLPPSDPYLQGRDRDLLVPDRERQKAVWRILGNPGAVLADAEVVATWRVRAGTKGRVDVTVTPFEAAALPRQTRAAIDHEAGRVARARGADDVRVIVETD